MEIMEMLRTRRTYRRFDQSRPIAKEALDDMRESLRLSSSAANLQPLQYIFVLDSEIVEKIFPHTHFAAILPKELGTPKQGEHPVMYVAVIFDKEKKTKWIDTDAGLAMSNLTLAAWNHGVGSCILDNVDRKEISVILALPKGVEIQSMIAFGYPTHTSEVVYPGEDGSLKYYLDEKKDYFVPKRRQEEFIFDNKYV